MKESRNDEERIDLERRYKMRQEDKRGRREKRGGRRDGDEREEKR